MGDQRVNVIEDTTKRHFISHLLRDMEALEYMLEENWFETDTIRIGAEQEMCLVKKSNYKPAMVAMQILERMEQYPWAETELALFNLEVNLSPQVFTGKSLSLLEEENRRYLRLIQQHADEFKAQVILTGILPTLRKFDLDLANLTPRDRYKALINSLREQLNGKDFQLRLSGIDEILIKHDSPLLEACNTSYQVHLQVTPDNFVSRYNVAQLVTSPVLALAANSPLVFGKRLWHESRIALFQQALDVRTVQDHMRERRPRVNFGTGWLEKSILEIYREDIARFRVLLGAEIQEDSIETIRQGRVPKLRALQVHNSTVYRWNRPCYGISDNGKPHLRIENRVLPAGPTVIDQIANAAFWLGCVVGFCKHHPNIHEKLSWEDARDNFAKAAKFGLDTEFSWLDDRKIAARDLILDQLLPIAWEGLMDQGIDKDDISRYLGVIEQRAKLHKTGARWMLKAYTSLTKQVNHDESLSVLTACLAKHQATDEPVHTWSIPDPEELEVYRPGGLKVEEFMETDLFTVQPDDLLGLVSGIMVWRKLRYLPVEDQAGKFCGLITNRKLLRHFSQQSHLNGQKNELVRDIMISKPVTISPSATISEAMQIMRNGRIGCLPVVKGDELIGIITEMDFLRISGRLLDRLENQEEC